MPNPRKGEKTKDYISRFTGNKEAVKDFPDPKQRAAVAYSKARQAGRKVPKKKNESTMFGLKTWSEFLFESMLLEDISPERQKAMNTRLEQAGAKEAYSQLQDMWMTKQVDGDQAKKVN